MNKRLPIYFCMLFLLVFFSIVLAVQSPKVIGNHGLIARARQETNVANAAAIDMMIAGSTIIDDTNHLFWFITGNEQQTHQYIPIEFEEVDNNTYVFVKSYTAIERCQDISACIWYDGYSFIINNPMCSTICLVHGDRQLQVPVGEIPFIYYYPETPDRYTFLDANGTEIR